MGYASLDGTTFFGFTYQSGAFTALPPAPLPVTGHGINDAGVVVGSALVGGTTAQGFIFNAGSYAFFSRPGWENTFGRAIGSSNLITGYSENPTVPATAGYIYNPLTSAYTDISPAGSLLTIAQGINVAGQVVGSAILPGSGANAFLREPDGTLTLFQIGTAPTRARGINDTGLITGFITVGGATQGFVGNSSGFQTLAVPGAADTFPEGINNAGQVAGLYRLGDGTTYGFMATPASMPTGTTSGGAYTFSVAVISIYRVKVGAALDPANPEAFPTELTFVAAGTFTGTMKPLTRSSASRGTGNCDVDWRFGVAYKQQAIGMAEVPVYPRRCPSNFWFPIAVLLGVTAMDAHTATTIDFDAMKAGAAPAGWACGMTGKGSPRWTIEADTSAPSAPQVLKQSGSATFPWCVVEGSSLGDGFVEVKFKPIAGREDQAGGVVWRWKDANRYYVARANALENNVSLYYTEGGSRKTVKYVDAPVGGGAWHVLRVEFSGRRIRVILDGVARIEVEDSHIDGPGAVGVWTKADSVTAFDDFVYGSPR